MTENDIKNLFEGIYEAIIHAQKEVEERFSKGMLDTYFEKDGTPKTIELNILDKVTKVPLITLIPNNNMKISEVTLDVELKLDRDKNKLIHRLFFSQKKNNAQLSIRFKDNEAPEGFAKINTKLLQLI